MKGIPKVFQTKQDVLNVHRLAMSNKIDRREWKKVLIELQQKTKYVLPIFKVMDGCFYIPYTTLPLPEAYQDNELVYGFDTTSTRTQPVDTVEMVNNSGVYEMMNEIEGGPTYNPNYQPPKSNTNAELMMLKIYASIDPTMNQLIIYHGCPFLEKTGMTQMEIDVLLGELI